MALIGLNAFNEYKGKRNDPNVTTMDILKLSVTNKQAIFVGVGMLVLYFMSNLSLQAYKGNAVSEPRKLAFDIQY